MQPYLLKSGLTSFWNETATEGTGLAEESTATSCEQLASKSKHVKPRMSVFDFFMNENPAGVIEYTKAQPNCAGRAFIVLPGFTACLFADW
jgi:hypothetical protein